MIRTAVDAVPIVDACKGRQLIRAAIRFLEPRVGHQVLRFAAESSNKPQAAQHQAEASTGPLEVHRACGHFHCSYRPGASSQPPFRSVQVLVRRGLRQGSAERPCMHGPALPGGLSGGTLPLTSSCSSSYQSWWDMSDQGPRCSKHRGLLREGGCSDRHPRMGRLCVQPFQERQDPCFRHYPGVECSARMQNSE